MEISKDKGLNCITPENSKVIYKDIITLRKKGEIVARVDGVFDFKDVPEEYHGNIVSLIQGRAITLYMNDDPLTPIEKKELENYRKDPKSLYDRFMGFFNGETQKEMFKPFKQKQTKWY
jgi:hypothetical protein